MSLSSFDPKILTALNEIAVAIDRNTEELNRVRGQRASYASPIQAATVIDYLVIRELLGRPAGDSRVIAAKRSKGNTITIYRVPGDATDLAAFTEGGNGPGVPDEIVALGTTKSASVTVTLTTIEDKDRIVRLELRNAVGHPIRLGPQLPAVV